MDGAQYWQIKSIELEGIVLRRELETAWQKHAMKKAAAYEAAGLDPAVTYTMDDATQTMTPVAQPPHRPPPSSLRASARGGDDAAAA